MLLVAYQAHLLGEAHPVLVHTVGGQVWSTIMAVARLASAFGVVRPISVWAFINLVFLNMLGCILDGVNLFPRNLHSFITSRLWIRCELDRHWRSIGLLRLWYIIDLGLFDKRNEVFEILLWRVFVNIFFEIEDKFLLVGLSVIVSRICYIKVCANLWQISEWKFDILPWHFVLYLILKI